MPVAEGATFERPLADIACALDRSHPYLQGGETTRSPMANWATRAAGEAVALVGIDADADAILASREEAA